MHPPLASFNLVFFSHDLISLALILVSIKFLAIKAIQKSYFMLVVKQQLSKHPRWKEKSCNYSFDKRNFAMTC